MARKTSLLIDHSKSRRENAPTYGCKPCAKALVSFTNGFIIARRSECHASAFKPHTIFRRLQFYETGGNRPVNALHLVVECLTIFFRPVAQAVQYGLIMFESTEKMSPKLRTALPEMIRAEDFKAEVLGAEQPVLVEFWTPWSRPCQILESVLQELAHELTGQVKVVKVNADDSLDLSLWYQIQSVPTLICFVEGKPCLRIVGTASKEAILNLLNRPGENSSRLVSTKESTSK